MHSASHPPAWVACLDAFERELTPQQFATWIRPLTCADESGRLRLTAPNRFVLQWVKDRFGGRIETLARQETGTSVAVEFAVADATVTRHVKPAHEAHGTLVAAPAVAPDVVPGPGASPAVAPRPLAPLGIVPARRIEPGSLNPTFTFNAFVAGKANQLARAAGLQVADHPTSYNPLFVYGGVGLGKTHLIHAIGHRILAENPAANIRYIHAETYVSDVVRAYQHKAFDEFKRNYRSLDLLLIDDIQFIGGKSRTQEEDRKSVV